MRPGWHSQSMSKELKKSKRENQSKQVIFPNNLIKNYESFRFFAVYLATGKPITFI